MQKLPIGEQDFIVLRKEGYVYVDKTPYIHRLMTGSGRFFFLSRPRRFGKSLLLSTIKAVFEAKKELFDGLYIHDKIDWEKRYPVLHLDMSGLTTQSIEKFESNLILRLGLLARSEGITLEGDSSVARLEELIELLYIKNDRPIVMLVDEYDKPIQDSLHKSELAGEIRDILREFYTVIKKQAEKLKFVFLTGVSKISQVSIFSGLNNLNDISLDERFAGICGYTQDELESGFSGHIGQLTDRESLSREQLLEKIRYWYNGYSWDGKTFVYNPFSTLLLFEKSRFDPHWFATGTPSFLLELMVKRGDFTPVLENEIIVRRAFSGSQSLEDMDTIALFFQTGYLTIKDSIGETYKLEIPNNEVRFSLSDFLLPRMTGKTQYEVKNLVDNFRRDLEQEDIKKAMFHLQLLFAHITYDTHLPHEKHYHALFQMALLLMGFPYQAENHSNKGRSDLIIRLEGLAYVIELKYAKSKKQLKSAATTALRQIRSNRYYETEMGKQRKIWLLGISFTKGDLEYSAEEHD